MSSDESDEDFVPGEPEKVSEEESADDETDLQYEQEQEHKAQKRKALQKPPTKKRKTKAEMKEIQKTPEELMEEQNMPQDEKKHEEDLWAKFLDGTDPPPKPKERNTAKPAETVTSLTKKDVQKAETKNDQKDIEAEKVKERQIFEFAGETLVVEDNIIKEKIKTTELPAAASKLEAVSTSRGRGGGLSSVLGAINRKSKLSTLEKSKLDWDTYKKQEGIEDEVKSDNKSKKGFLERQDFLDRADLRQYEIERDLRMSRRSKR